MRFNHGWTRMDMDDSDDFLHRGVRARRLHQGMAAAGAGSVQGRALRASDFGFAGPSGVPLPRTMFG